MLKEDVSSIVPMPPSTQRAFRPVTEIAESLSDFESAYVRQYALRKTAMESFAR